MSSCLAKGSFLSRIFQGRSLWPSKTRASAWIFLAASVRTTGPRLDLGGWSFDANARHGMAVNVQARSKPKRIRILPMSILVLFPRSPRGRWKLGIPLIPRVLKLAQDLGMLGRQVLRFADVVLQVVKMDAGVVVAHQLPV